MLFLVARMSFSIQKGEKLAAALGRIAGEEMDLAIDQLRRDGGAPIHAARKALKRLRALLRSLQVALPRKVYCKENDRLGEAGRIISPLRDAHVQLETLRKLEAARSPAARKLHHVLLHQQSQIIRNMPRLRRSVRRMLDASRDQMSSWPLQAATPRGLAAGFRRIYKQARSAARDAEKNPTPENLHEWRKKAKALGYGFELLEDVGSGKISKLRRCSNCLTDCLGDDHDLFVLLQALRQENDFNPDKGFIKLAGQIARKRHQLQRRAFKTGEKIHCDKPEAFEKEIVRFLKKAQKKNHH